MGRTMTTTTKRKQALPPEDKGVVSMLRFEKSLPQLPVNTLVETSAKWLESVKPFCMPTAPSTLDQGPTDAYARCQQLADEFVTSPVSRELQQRLKDRAAAEENWLSKWWNELAYFSVRDPLVTANYFYSHVDDKKRRTPALRAAGLIRALLFFRRLVET